MRTKGTKLTLCELVGMGLLRQCVSLDEARAHSFERALGVGLNGFVFSCIYKKQQRRVIKMVMVGDPDDEPIQLDEEETIVKVPERLLRREWQMHRSLMDITARSTSPEFRVVKVYGNLCVFKPPLSDDRVGAYVMEELPFPTLQQQLRATKVPAPHVLKKIQVIPKVIAAFHRLGMAHSDLHYGNIAFDPRPNSREPPYVIDFGRALDLDSALPDKKEQSKFRVLEFMIPLYAFCRVNKPPKIAAKFYNAFLKGMQGVVDNLPSSFNKRATGLLEEVYRLLPTTSLVSDKELGDMLDRREHVCDLLFAAKFFHSGKHSYLDIAAGDI